jgi:hypothetical protein
VKVYNFDFSREKYYGLVSQTPLSNPATLPSRCTFETYHLSKLHSDIRRDARARHKALPQAPLLRSRNFMSSVLLCPLLPDVQCNDICLHSTPYNYLTLFTANCQSELIFLCRSETEPANFSAQLKFQLNRKNVFLLVIEGATTMPPVRKPF